MSSSVAESVSITSAIGQHPSMLLGQRRNRKVVMSVGAGAFQRLVQVASTVVVMPLLLHVLGAAKFGIWGAAASLAWLSGLMDIGTGTALVTLVARSSAAEGADGARRHVSGALSIGSGVGCGIVVAATLALVATDSRGWAWPYLIAAIGLGVNIPLSASNNIWMALQKGYVSGFWELVQTLVTTAGLVIAAMVTRDIRVFVGIVYLGLVLANSGSLIHLFRSHPELRPRGLTNSWAAMRDVAGQGILYFVMALVGSLAFVLDNVLALWLLGPEASARMTIALRICITAAGALVVLSQPLWPAFADAAERTDWKWIRKGALRGSALLVGLTLAGSSLLLVYGERLLHWWLRTNLGISRGLLWAIAAWVFAQALVRIPVLLLNGLSVLHYQIAVISIATLVALTLKFALAPYFGVAGILWGTSTAVLLIVVPAAIWRIWRWAVQPSPQGGKLG